MEETEVVSDDQFDELAEYIEECLFAILFCDPSSYDAPVSIQGEIQTLFIGTSVHEFMETPCIVAPVCDQLLDDVPILVSSEI